MHVLIIGAAGMIGRKLAQRLIRDGGLGGGEISALTLVDVTTPENPEEFAGRVLRGESRHRRSTRGRGCDRGAA